MPANLQPSHTARSWRPGQPSADGTGHPILPRKSDLPDICTARRPHVLHDQWGLGRALHGSTGADAAVAVEFQTGIHRVPATSLRRLLPLTVLARILGKADTRVTAWSVRKAHDQGAIQPDVTGRFAGHRVHFYDVARIPDLIRQLSQPDPWRIGTRVMHSRYGAGVITGYGQCPGAEPAGPHSRRAVAFFQDPFTATVPVPELRRLIPSHVLARRVGVNRRHFPRLAALRGIHPDYIQRNRRTLEFYDESRTDVICQRWKDSATADKCHRGSLVADADGEPVRIEARDARGEAHIRELRLRGSRRTAHVTTLRELVSLRELARREGMSRYRLQRLLTATGIPAAHHGGKTLYYDPIEAQAALRQQLALERNAFTVRMLAMHTGVSPAMLTGKIRGGVIRTLGHHAAHHIHRDEADRIARVVQANHSRSGNLESLGICAVHRRGRAGAEVVRWHLTRFLEIAQSLSTDRRAVLFGQVAWMCEGAGGKRFREAMDAYLASLPTVGQFKGREDAELLLPLMDFLPGQSGRYRLRLLLIAAGHGQTYACFEQRVRQSALLSGCNHPRSLERFRTDINHCLTTLLTPDLALPTGPQCHEDECTPGAIVLWGRDRRPQAGVIVRVEQQRWDAVAQAWNRTLTIRFPQEERRICSGSRLGTAGRPDGHESVHLLLRASEVRTLACLLHPNPAAAEPHRRVYRRAS